MLDHLLQLGAGALERLGPEHGLMLFVVVAAIAPLTFLPRPALCVIGGFAFGLSAIPLTLVASTLGAMLAFELSRRWLRPRFEAKLAVRPKFRAVVAAANAEGWRVVVLLRLGGPLPGTATNYLLGLTRIGLWPYAGATLVGSAPQVAAYVYLGVLGGVAVEAQAIGRAEAAFMVAGLLALAAAVWLITRRARSLMRMRLGGSEA
jgi:uncharacterized membrane protein YdjX (TVP38/TMEM64 family)